MPTAYESSFAFYEQLKSYYSENRGKVRSRYNDLTRKFLSYNDRAENPDAFLRKPQFEALEMYVFVKEFMNNKQVYEMFDDWRNHRDRFSDASYYAVERNGQIRLGEELTAKQTDVLIEVKGDNKIDDAVVKAKATAAEEMAVASGVKYLMYAGSTIVKSHILDNPNAAP